MSLNRAGALTTVQTSAIPWRVQASYGLDWVSCQAQNGGNNPVDYDLAAIRAEGIGDVGVWGVTYKPEEFLRDGKLLGQQAVKLGADHVIMDAEECAKRTRAARGLKPIIEGLRAGGWAGPVSLSTLGAPSNPDVNDFEIDVESFLETGGLVLPQAYANDWPDQYMPDACVSYWTRVGVPRDRLNLTISLTAGDTSKVRLPGSAWLPLLEQGGLGAAFSLFMAEYATPDDLAALEPLAKTPPAPAGPPAPTSDETKRLIVDAVGRQVHHWHVVLGYAFGSIAPATGQKTPIKATRIYQAGNRVAPLTFPLP